MVPLRAAGTPGVACVEGFGLPRAVLTLARKQFGSALLRPRVLNLNWNIVLLSLGVRHREAIR